LFFETQKAQKNSLIYAFVPLVVGLKCTKETKMKTFVSFVVLFFAKQRWRKILNKRNNSIE